MLTVREEAGPTYTVERQGQVGGGAPARGGKVLAGRRLRPGSLSGGGGGGGGGVVFTKVRDELPPWFSQGPEGQWRWIRGVFVWSQPGVWRGRNYL